MADLHATRKFFDKVHDGEEMDFLKMIAYLEQASGNTEEVDVDQEELEMWNKKAQ